MSAELIASATQLGGVAYIDAPIGITVQQVIAGRGPLGVINFNTSSDRARLCYPHVKVYNARTNSDRLQPLGCGFMEHHHDSVEKVRSNGGASEARR